jgi:hypothetical protein
VSSRLVRVTVMGLVVAGAAMANAQEPPTNPDAVDRVRAKLEKPAGLVLQLPVADFTIHIEKRRPMQDIFDTPPWATDPVGWQPPAVGFDLLSVFRYAVKSAADAKRGRDERLAREEVQRAIADFCAAQPATNTRPAAAQMCATSPAIR